MSFKITEEAVKVMREVAKNMINAIDDLHQADREIISCYEQVRHTIGPHSRQIQIIVKDVEKILKRNRGDISEASGRLDQVADQYQLILDKKIFKNSLKVDITPNVYSNGLDRTLASEAPTIGQRIKQKGKQTEYERD